LNSRSHKLRTLVITAVAVIVILLALLFSLFRMAVPYITDYGDDIEVELSQKLGVKVEIGMVEADIQWLVPSLKLLDVNVYDKTGLRHLLHFASVNLSLDWFKSIEKGKPELGFFSIDGLDLQLARDRHGVIYIQGFPVKSTGKQQPVAIPDEVMSLLEKSDLYIKNATLRWSDELHNRQHLDITKLNIAFLNDGNRHQLSVAFELPPRYGGPMAFKAKIHGDWARPGDWDTQLYLSMENFRLQKWFDDYWQLFDFRANGQVNANVWVNIKHKTLQNVSGYMEAQQLSLHYLANDIRSWNLDHLMGQWRYTGDRQGWNMNIRGLEIERNGKKWQTPAAISITDDRQLQQLDLMANYLRAEDLVYLGGLASNLGLLQGINWENKVAAYAPHGDLYDLKLHLPMQQLSDASLQARMLGVSLKSYQGTPGFSGLSGQLNYQQQHARLDLDSGVSEIDLPGLFEKSIPLNGIRGHVDLDYAGHDLLVYSDYLALNTPDIKTASRFHFVRAQQQPASLDLVTRFDQGQGKSIETYLPVKVMNKASASWLSRSILGGDVSDGRLVFRGDAGHFPFRDHSGVMDISFLVDNGILQYQPRWPKLDNVHAHLRFLNNTMRIDAGSGNIYSTRFHDTRVSIENLGDSHLSITGQVDGKLNEMIRFVNNSPLTKPLAFFKQIQAEGNSHLDLALEIPVADTDSTTVSGKLKLENNRLSLPNQGYDFDGIDGQLGFSEKQVQGSDIKAHIKGDPLDVGVSYVADEDSPLTRIHVKTHTDAANLLAPAPFLTGYFSGKSDWLMDIDIPMHHQQGQPQLSVRAWSSLAGTGIDLPAPLGKVTTSRQALDLDIRLYEAGNLSVDIADGDVYVLNLERNRKWWKGRLDSDILKGNIRFDGDLSADETMKLDLDYINLSQVFPADNKERKQNLSPGQLPPLKVSIKKLDWKKWQLQDLSLESHREAKGMIIDRLEIHGPDTTLTGKGQWINTWRTRQLTELQFNLSSTNLGRALDQLHLTKAIKDSKGAAQFNWSWEGAPYAFDWKDLEGTGHILLRDGRLKDFDAGAGRILGILNFETLLSLDFGNQVSNGFAFDKMEGGFSFTDGSIYTDNFKVESKVAEVKMKGRIGIDKEDYDQTVTVIPGVGSTLTVIGTVAGGPLIGAAVHFIQKLFGVDRLAEYKYTVTGSWDKPDVKLVSAPKHKSTQTDGDIEYE